MFQQKRMFKVITPIDRRDGGKFWMRLGTAYVNKDNSINAYIDAIPLVPSKDGQGVTLQLREFTDEELRERDEKKATYNARGTLSNQFTPPAQTGPAAVDAVPF
ncbi:MAG TPA: hypothetical protein VFV99_24605 [Kofleriaceae bacterium]|nr:hypothetical protein [Kofleriaceae bacterium]